MTWWNKQRFHHAQGTRRFAAGFVLLAIGFGASQSQAAGSPLNASSARDYYNQAAGAFRNGDYAEAVALYQAADSSGYDNPAVFYNLGVAHYKLGEFDEAEAAFATASTDPDLAALAYYNLGLVARKEGNNTDARGWFHQAAKAPNASAKLVKLSHRALATMPEVRRKAPSGFAEREAGLRDFLNFSFNSGYAYDSNIYRAPGESYLDLADPLQPQVDPLKQSGSFVPLQADVEFHWGTNEHSYFLLDYEFDGRFYTDSAYSNANTYKNTLALGGKAMVPKKNGYRYWHSRFEVGLYDENYYDRDDGQDQLIGGVDVSDRFKRTKFGPSAYYHRKIGWLGYGFRAEGFINDYADTVDYLDLTHEQYLAGAHISYYPFKATELRVGYDWYRRQYADRKAKDENGIRFTNNDELEYDFASYNADLRQKLGRRLSMNLSYRYTTRSDDFAGYDDYTRHSGKATLRFRAKRFYAYAGVTYRTYDFPNAFTFDLLAAGAKELDTTYATAEMSYRFLRNFSLRLEGKRDIVNSSDPRADYDRDQIALSLDWTL